MPPTSSRRSLASRPIVDRAAGDPPAGVADAVDVSRYVADICGELSKMTKSARLVMLSYLLGMVRQEAERVARDGAGRK